jgi:hypothetical protein
MEELFEENVNSCRMNMKLYFTKTVIKILISLRKTLLIYVAELIFLLLFCSLLVLLEFYFINFI